MKRSKGSARVVCPLDIKVTQMEAHWNLKLELMCAENIFIF